MKSTLFRTRATWILPLIVLLVAGLAPARPGRPPSPAAGDAANGLLFRLSDGASTIETLPQRGTSPSLRPLSAAAADRLLASLSPLPPAARDASPFRKRDSALPRPRTGKTLPQPFPVPSPPAAAPKGTEGALHVLRYAPYGNVALAPQVSITFSNPMVAVTSLDDLAAKDVPVRLTPQPAGTWRWIGTKTLLFEPSGRLPMATEYAVEVPAETRDAGGRTLAQAVRWTFRTPPPQLQRLVPSGGPVGRSPVMVAVFDQTVDPTAVLSTIRTTPSATLRLATEAERNRDPVARSTFDTTAAGRAVAFVASEPFPTATQVTVSVGPGTPSLEGPLKTDAAQSSAFQTYGPMKVEEAGCGYGGDCPPLSPWHIRFSNPIDAQGFSPSMVSVKPPLPDMKISVSGAYVSITGRSKGRTSYTMTLDPKLPDIFGQTLGSAAPIAIQVGSARPGLAGPREAFILADPFVPPSYAVFSINHPRLRVRMYRVTPADWARFVDHMQRKDREDSPPTPPGTRVSDALVETNGAPDELTESTIDLRPALRDGLGSVIVTVEPETQPKRRWERRSLIAWVQATRIGLDAVSDGTQLAASATALTDGRPMGGVEVTLSDSDARAATAENGLCTLALPRRPQPHRVLLARKGDDVAFLPQSRYWWSGDDAWSQTPRRNALRWFVFDDRGIYKPNETVHFKGWLRTIENGPKGDVRGLDSAIRTVRYRVVDSRGNEVCKGEAPVGDSGGFSGGFRLPDAMNLGQATLRLEAVGAAGLDGVETSHGFQVEEFRRPEFEVATRTQEGPFFVGGHARITTEARYYTGGGLPDAAVTWQVNATEASFSPPGHSEYTFGRWTPWFWWGEHADRGTQQQAFTSHTDASGAHVLRVDFDAARPPLPTTLKAEATVTDVNRQAWSSSTSLLVHPASEYVGLHRERLFVDPGDAVDLDVIVADLEGRLVSDRAVRIRAVRLDWEWRGDRAETVESDVEEGVATSAGKPVRFTLHPKKGGTWRVQATVTDAKGRANLTELMVWVTGGTHLPQREVSAERLVLVPDRQSYAPGDVAHVMVQAPFPDGHGTFVVSRSGIISTRAFDLKGTSATIDIPIDATWPPNAELEVEVVGASARKTDSGQPDPRVDKRPAYALGALTLRVPPLQRRLKVEALPRDVALTPGAETSIDVTVTDASGAPVKSGEVAVVVVDEAILALTGYRLDDPMNVFYALRGGDTRDWHARQEIVLGRTDAQDVARLAPTAQRAEMTAMPAPAGAAPPEADGMAARRAKSARNGGGAEDERSPIALRSNFDPLACFSPAVRVSNGRAAVKIRMPDNLTRYRVMAVGVSGPASFGSGESAITARLPLMVRPSPPRFLNFGDRFSLPVVLQNQTATPLRVEIAARASNLRLLEPGYALTVPANDRVEVLFPAATERAGTARLQIAARGEAGADAAEVSLPVYTPATTEAFATNGVIDGDAVTVQPVKPPGQVFPQFGGLEVELSSTALQALTDAMLYLVRYPFECAEQVSSRVIGIVALRDVLAAFAASDLPDAKILTATVKQDLETLRRMQNADGGFAFWRGSDPSWPYVSVHVANALVRAREKAIAVPPAMIDGARRYLRAIESHIPRWYGEQERNAIVAYALNVRWRMEDRDVERARRLVAQGLPPARGTAPPKETLSVEAMGWLLPVLARTAPAGNADATCAAEVETLKRRLDNRVTETAGAASFTTHYTDGQHLLLATNRRADAIVLEALVQTDPRNDLIPKIVRGLLGHRSAGHWLNTQENVFVLLALDSYFQAFEKQTPDFVARLWLGDDYAGEHVFRGRSTDRLAVDVPMKMVVETAPKSAAGDKSLVIGKQGKGRLYYRIGMRYAPRDLDLKPLDAGFTVQRRYEAADDPGDVTREANGTYHIKAGARVRVRVTMVASSRRVHVALIDPLPAGLEVLNPYLAVQGALPRERDGKAPSNPFWYWYRPWFEHQNLRDERAEAFTSLLWEGVYDYTYYARATTPGQFVVPPAKAEQMYEPEVFGRSGTDRVTVK